MAQRMERGKMPKTLSGLLNWYVASIREETPDRLHIIEPWHDRVSTHELKDGVQPVGGSHLGTLAYANAFRSLLEGSPSVTDEDGFYVTPIRAALSRMARRKPFMVMYLFSLAQAEGDWRRLADVLGYPLEFIEAVTEQALAQLWTNTYDRTTKGMR